MIGIRTILNKTPVTPPINDNHKWISNQ